MNLERRIVIDGNLYRDVAHATEVLQLSDTVIEHRCQSKLPQWGQWYYIRFTKKSGPHIAVWFKGQRFDSERQVAITLKLSSLKVQMYIHSTTCLDSGYELSCNEPNGVLPDVVKLNGVTKPVEPITTVKQKREVIINKVTYASVADASRRLGIGSATVGNRIRSKSPEWFEWRFADKYSGSRSRLIQYVIHGQKYKTISDAAKRNNVTGKEIRSMIEDPKHGEHHYITMGVPTKNLREAFKYLKDHGVHI
jgi:hypothetical protein